MRPKMDEAALGEREEARWFGRLPQNTREKIRPLYARKPAYTLVIFVFLGLWAAAGAYVLNASSCFARLPGYLLIAAVLHAIGILMHEAVHGSLFRERRLDRLGSVVLGAPVFLSGTAYRVVHLRHHGDTGGPGDPDELKNLFTTRSARRAAFYGWALFALPIFLIHVPFRGLRLASPKDKWTILAEYLGLLVLFGGAGLALARREWLRSALEVWLIPVLFTSLLIALRGWSEHMLTAGDRPLRRTRTVTSNAVVRFFLLNLNYHLEHHLFPGVPWYNLGKLHRLLENDLRAEGAPICTSYLSFLWSALWSGGRRLVPQPMPRDRGRST